MAEDVAGSSSVRHCCCLSVSSEAKPGVGGGGAVASYHILTRGERVTGCTYTAEAAP